MANIWLFSNTQLRLMGMSLGMQVFDHKHKSIGQIEILTRGWIKSPHCNFSSVKIEIEHLSQDH